MAPRKYPDELVKKVIELRRTGVTAAKIAETCGVKIDTVYFLTRKDSACPKRPNHTPEFVEKVLSLRKQGLSIKDISKQLSCKEKTVQHVCCNNGVTLTPEQRKAIQDTPKVKAKLSKTAKNNWKDPIIRSKILNSMTSAEYRQKQSADSKARWANPEYAARHTNKLREIWQRPGHQEKMRKIRKQTGATPEFKDGARERMMARWEDPRWVDSRLHFTWENLAVACEPLKLKVLSDTTQRFSKNNIVKFSCFCTREFTCMAKYVMNGDKISCGCTKSKEELRVLDHVRLTFPSAAKTRTALPSGLELDIYVPELKFAIEYCGLYWHSDAPKFENGREEHFARLRHVNKLRECQQQGIRLLTIFEDEWLAREGAVRAFIDSIIKPPTIKIGARKTVITKDATKINSFIEDNHLQGSVPMGTTYAVGLEFNGQIVSAMTFTKNNLTRYCVSPGTSVSGGFQKLLSSFKVDNPTIAVIESFSDLRYSSGGVYERNGFTKTKFINPDYFYVKRLSRFHKFLFRKPSIEKKLGALHPDETEREAMYRFGFHRIWDCGKEKWELTI